MRFKLTVVNIIPGQLDNFEKQFSASTGDTNHIDRLNNSWRTEIGELNQAVHLWRLGDSNDSDDKDSQIPQYDYSGLAEYITEIQSRRINVPESFVAYVRPTKANLLSEIRIYFYQRESIAEVVEKWNIKLEDRVKLSPLHLCGFTDTWPTSEWIHIWPYKDLNERQEIRDLAIKQELWSPGAFNGLVSQQSFVVKPAKNQPNK